MRAVLRTIHVKLPLARAWYQFFEPEKALNDETLLIEVASSRAYFVHCNCGFNATELDTFSDRTHLQVSLFLILTEQSG